MDALQAQVAPHASKLYEYSACHCGHCFTTIAVDDSSRQVRCPGCGRPNAIPRYISVVCDRCHATQRVRFSQRHNHPLCTHCSYSLDTGAIELLPQDRRPSESSHRHHRGHKTRHDSIVFTIVLYAVALILFLLWITQQ